jgi:hypothetical protein
MHDNVIALPFVLPNLYLTYLALFLPQLRVCAQSAPMPALGPIVSCTSDLGLLDFINPRLVSI